MVLMYFRLVMVALLLPFPFHLCPCAFSFFDGLTAPRTQDFVNCRRSDDEYTDRRCDIEAGRSNEQENILNPVDQCGPQHDAQDGSTPAVECQSTNDASGDSLQR